MKTLDLIKTLGYGVLNNTKYAKVDVGNPDEILPLLTLIQEGLTRLYTRFIIREKHVIVEMQVGITFYHLTKLYSVQNGDPVRVPHPYIMDLPNEPFQEDVIKILRVMDTQNNVRPLNDDSRNDSLTTPQFDVLHNPYPRDLEALFVNYQANHVPLLTYLVDGEYGIEEEIILPPVLEPALINYVAWMVHSRVGTAESSAKAATHLQMYEMVCKDVEAFDSVNNSKSSTNVRFDLNGWT